MIKPCTNMCFKCTCLIFPSPSLFCDDKHAELSEYSSKSTNSSNISSSMNDFTMSPSQAPLPIAYTSASAELVATVAWVLLWL